MTRWRLLPLLLGAGSVLLVTPGFAAAPPVRPAPVVAAADPAALLQRAALAARSRSFTGVQFASAWAPGATTATVADVRHTPGTGSRVTARSTVDDARPAPPTASTTELDPRLLRLLSVHYQLEVAAAERCAGRTTDVVVARRLDSTVAGRFWVDQETGLLLRREVYDDAGQLVRSSAFTTLEVQPAAAAVPPLEARTADVPDADKVARLRSRWPVPDALPGGLDLFESRVRTHEGTDVLHLSYSDGLSVLSVFAQPGHLGSEPMGGLHEKQMAGAPVWASDGSPERLVWSGAGQVFTLLSDAPAATVAAAVTALPHDPPPRTGVLARIGRGLARLASWINPFD